MSLRRCKGRCNVYEDGKWHSHEFELGYFHQWGVNYEEFEGGPGNYTVAIVELPDGRIVMPVADDIVFLDTIRESDNEPEDESKQCPYNEERCYHYFMGICDCSDVRNKCPHYEKGA